MARTRKSARRAAGGKEQAARTTRASRGPDALAILKQEHDQTRKLFQDLAEAEGPDRRELFQRLADALAAHAEVEEMFLYPEIVKLEELADATRDAVEEHLIVKRLLADMLERDLEEEVFDAKCRVLEAEMLRHIEEEEAALLPRAKRVLERDRFEEMGREIERNFQELMQHEPRKRIPQETEAAPTLH